MTEKIVAIVVLAVVIVAFAAMAIFMAVKGQAKAAAGGEDSAQAKTATGSKEGKMSRNLGYYLLAGLFAVAGCVLWLLKALSPEKFAGFSYSWIVAIVSGGAGAVFLAKGLLQKNTGILKKLNVYFGAGLILVAFLCVVFALTLPLKVVPPVIALVAVAALVIGLIACGGKKWDHGDNQSAGYKNYYQRKAEEEKQNAEKQDKK